MSFGIREFAYSQGTSVPLATLKDTKLETA